MASKPSLVVFAVLSILVQVAFAFIYGFRMRYFTNFFTSNFTVGLPLTLGQLVTVELMICLLIGFGLITTYIKRNALTGLLHTILILAITIQSYFLFRAFWIYTGLGYDNQVGAFQDEFFAKITTNSYDYRIAQSDIIATSTFSHAVAAAIATYVAYSANLGQTGPATALIFCLIGQFFYCLNEIIFWRHVYADNGYTMRIFLFGSSMGLASALLKKKFIEGEGKCLNYFSEKKYQMFAFIGAVFVWIHLPWLSVIDQLSPTGASTYAQIAPINTFLALSASCCTAYATTILINRKIAVHDIIFSSFSGAIAYGASSNVMINPFPALLVGIIVSAASTALNSLVKKKINRNNVFDAQGILFTYFVPSLIGAIFCSIYQAVGAQDAGSGAYVGNGRNNLVQGGHQLAAMCISLGIGALSGLVCGGISRVLGERDNSGQLFLDDVHLMKDNKNTHTDKVVSEDITPNKKDKQMEVKNPNEVKT